MGLLQSNAVQDLHRLETVPTSALSFWGLCAFVIALGSSFGRSFFYIGIAPAHLFIGDFVLGMFLIFCADESLGVWIRMLIGPSDYTFYAWCLLISCLYGGFEVYYGLQRGYPILTALENLVFNIYPLYFIFGIWIGEQYPTLLKKSFRGLAWILAIYGPLYFLYLDKLQWTIPGSTTPVFSQAGGGGMIILSLLAFESRPRRFWPLMVIAGIIMLAVQVRAEWISTGIAFVIWGLLERKMKFVGIVTSVLLLLLVVGYVADVDLPSPQERGGSISTREIVARGLSAISPSLAEEYTDSSNISFYYGTIYWRTRWWHAIWDSVQDNNTSMLIGNGYGFPLSGLVSYLAGSDIRTPHNIAMYALGYTGWIGLSIFFALQLAVMLLAWKAYRRTGQAWALAFWCAGLVSAFFGNSLESPMGAIPFYLLLGLAIGPALCGITVQDHTRMSANLPLEALRTRPYQRPAFVPTFRVASHPSAGES
jgi:hypothetical protein